MNTVQANGIKLAYDSFGDKTNEVILLIAGLGTQMFRWTGPFYEGLVAHGYHVIRFDNRDADCSTHFSQCPAGFPHVGSYAHGRTATGRSLHPL